MPSLKLTLAASLLFCGASYLHAQTPRPEPVAGVGETAISDEIDAKPVKPSAVAAEKNRVATTQIATVKTGDQPQATDPYKKSTQMWKISLVALVGGNALDAISSWGKHESNPLLRSNNGTFGMKGLGIKSTIVGASLAPQLLLRDHKELKKTFAIINTAEATFFSVVAFHNFGIPAPKLLK